MLPPLRSPAILLLLSILLYTGCTSTQLLRKSDYRQLDELVTESPVFNRSFTGFALYDPAEQQYLYQRSADKYFTPASNTKIFTLYTALKVLGDNWPLLHYYQLGDTLIVEGAGNPMLLHPDFPDPEAGLGIIRDHAGPLFFSEHNWDDDHFGPGWSWADYPYSYQAERSPLPLHGNLVHFTKDSLQQGFSVSPKVFYAYLQQDNQLIAPFIRRDLTGNTLRYSSRSLSGRELDQRVPFDYEPRLATRLLSGALGRRVEVWNGELPPGLARHTLTLPAADTLYRRLMHNSDNFIAEQLLLMSAGVLSDTLNSFRAIRYSQDSLLAQSPDALQWWDGSGLSRYNLFTPRSVVFVLEKLYSELPAERLFDIFASGGRQGTIRHWYGGEANPYVFAKTGTLRNKHCLSGYLLTASGKTLIFSFMHNNYVGSSSPLKREMQHILHWMHQNL